MDSEQVENIKKQLIEQIEASFPEEKKQFAISQIESMDSEQLEEFLIKNGLTKDTSKNGSSPKCVFCSIVFGDISSYKISENEKAIAVLEINPLTRGHVIIIPKEHIASEKQFPPQILQLAKKMSSLLKSNLWPKEVKMNNSNIMGHEIVNLIPIYTGQEDLTKRTQASPEELNELQAILAKKPTKPKKIKITVKKEKTPLLEKANEIKEKMWLPKRIP
jgi:diadenosine tetraphosphate (Ap4A) HIT family hydrolase